jgi:hypothetical protein
MRRAALAALVSDPTGDGAPGPDLADCAVCGVHLAAGECRRCGDPACEFHLSTDELCADCAARRSPDGRRGDPDLL